MANHANLGGAATTWTMWSRQTRDMSHVRFLRSTFFSQRGMPAPCAICSANVFSVSFSSQSKFSPRNLWIYCTNSHQMFATW